MSKKRSSRPLLSVQGRSTGDDCVAQEIISLQSFEKEGQRNAVGITMTKRQTSLPIPTKNKVNLISCFCFTKGSDKNALSGPVHVKRPQKAEISVSETMPVRSSSQKNKKEIQTFERNLRSRPKQTCRLVKVGSCNTL